MLPFLLLKSCCIVEQIKHQSLCWHNNFIGATHRTSLPHVSQWANKGLVTMADTWNEDSNTLSLGKLLKEIWILNMGKLIWERLITNLEPWQEDLKAPSREILHGGEWVGFFLDEHDVVPISVV